LNEQHINTPDGLSQLCNAIRSSSWIALDTEFIRDQTYYPELCLLQLSNGEIAASVDPIALSDLTPLLDILFNPAIVKVLHSGRQDLEIFQNSWQQIPQPLFDTQVAAKCTGLGDQLGYANLVKLLLDVDLSKSQTRTDWARRPLTEQQLRYALDDVIYLGDLYQQMNKTLHGKPEDAELQQALAHLADPATYRTEPQQAWLRVRERRFLKGVELAVLQALASWRETEAMRANRPRGWILKNDVLVELSRRQPRTQDELQGIQGLTAKVIERRAEVLLKLIADALSLPPARWPKERRKKR